MDKSPDAFRTISEVSEWLETPAHVLRFWESRFSQLKPVKRAGGRRYYRPGDMALLGGIKKLLHDDGLTIRGVQKILREQGVRHVAAIGAGAAGGRASALQARDDDISLSPADYAEIDSAGLWDEDDGAPMEVDAVDLSELGSNVVRLTPPGDAVRSQPGDDATGAPPAVRDDPATETGIEAEFSALLAAEAVRRGAEAQETEASPDMDRAPQPLFAMQERPAAAESIPAASPADAPGQPVTPAIADLFDGTRDQTAAPTSNGAPALPAAAETDPDLPLACLIRRATAASLAPHAASLGPLADRLAALRARVATAAAPHRG